MAAKQKAHLRLESCWSIVASAISTLRTLWWSHQCLDEAKTKKMPCSSGQKQDLWCHPGYILMWWTAFDHSVSFLFISDLSEEVCGAGAWLTALFQQRSCFRTSWRKDSNLICKCFQTNYVNAINLTACSVLLNAQTAIKFHSTALTVKLSEELFSQVLIFTESLNHLGWKTPLR